MWIHTSGMQLSMASGQVSIWIIVTLLLVLIQASLSAPNAPGRFPRSRYNTIDKCWRKNSNWASDRMRLATCGKGFGAEATGGRGGRYYTVTVPDDHAINPLPGTLRYGVTRPGPVWITFARDMNIKLQMPLFIANHKTIDARGAKVTIGSGPCIRIWNVSNIIIHGLNIHYCKASGPGVVMISKGKGTERIYPQDGDAISIVHAKNVWIDHNALSRSTDGLIDITLGSTDVTISNNRFFDQSDVMLLGNSDWDPDDKRMRVTIVFNRFEPGLLQRMPRVRKGYVHVANNNYEAWGIYAIGGSAGATILSEGNRFQASDDYTKKQVTEHSKCAANCAFRSINDKFLKGAYFREVGDRQQIPPMYTRQEAFKVAHGKVVGHLTKNAGPLDCHVNRRC